MQHAWQVCGSLLCPKRALCRAPLPRGSENSFEFALREYTAVAREVMASGGSWRVLSAYDEKRMEEVVRCAHAASDQGHPGAQTLLGDLYLHGEGLPKSEADGLAWYRKAAEQGYARAQRKLDAALVGQPSNHEAKVTPRKHDADLPTT